MFKRNRQRSVENIILTTEQDYILNSHEKRKFQTMPQPNFFIEQLQSHQSQSGLPSIKSMYQKNHYLKQFIKLSYWKTNIQRKLSSYHYNLIGDSSFIFEAQTINTFQLLCNFKNESLQRFKQHINQYLTQIQIYMSLIPLIYPDTTFKIFFDLLSTAARLYFLYVIPIDLAWNHQQFLFEKFQAPTILFLTILLLDIILGFNTAQYKSGQLIKNRNTILKLQLTQLYGMEWISTLILLIIFIFGKENIISVDVNENSWQLLLLLFLTHHVKVNKIVNQYELALDLSKTSSSILELIKLILLFFYIIHLFSCLWFWAGGYSQSYQENNWIDSSNLQNQEWNIQYLSAFYYACVTSFTVGYGDITPKSDLEKILTVSFIMISSIQLPYSVNLVGAIVEKLSSEKEEKRKKLRTFNAYMQKKKIPFNLQIELREYLDHYWEAQNKEESEEEKNIISQLSENLRTKLYLQAHQEILNKNSLFRFYFSQQFKLSLLKSVKYKVFQPEQVVDSDDKFICFIEEGELEVFVDQGANIKLKSITKGEWLGLKSFVTGQKVIEKYKSVGFTKLLIVNRRDFLEIIQDYPQDYEVFCRVKDDLIYNQDGNIFKQNCFSCGYDDHQLIQCPLLHYAPQKDQIIKKFIFNKIQKRVKLERLKKKKQKTLFSQNLKEEFITQNQSLVSKLQTYKSINTKAFLSQKQFQFQFSHKDIRAIQEKTRSKFQRIVNKVKAQNRLKIKLQKQINYMTDYFYYVEQLQLKLEQAKQNTFYSEKDIEDLQLLLLNIKNMRKFTKLNMINFEQAKKYNVYFPLSNKERIIKLYNSKKWKMGGKFILQRFLPYLKYPGEFIKKFRLDKQYQRQTLMIFND